MVRKIRKQRRQDFFHAEWLAHEAAKEEEAQDFDFLTGEIENENECDEQDDKMEVVDVIA